MRSLFVVLTICATVYGGPVKSGDQLADFEVTDWKDEPFNNDVGIFIQLLKDKTLANLVIPNQKFIGPNILVLLSTGLELSKSQLSLTRDFVYEIGYENDVPKTYSLTFNPLLASDYLLRLGLGLMPFLSYDTEGSITVDVDDLKISGELAYERKPPRLQLKTMNITVNDIKIKIDKILDSERFGSMASMILSYQITSQINAYQKYFSDGLRMLANIALMNYFPIFSTDPIGFVRTLTEDSLDLKSLLSGVILTGIDPFTIDMS